MVTNLSIAFRVDIKPHYSIHSISRATCKTGSLRTVKNVVQVWTVRDNAGTRPAGIPRFRVRTGYKKMEVYIVLVADCRDYDLTDKGWSTALICKAWHLELSVRVALTYPVMSWAWPCENSLARWRQRQFAYHWWTP